MPDAILVQVADAVTTALNGAAAGTFNRDFEAERSYADWELPLEETAPDDRVFVDVTPAPPLESELESRGLESRGFLNYSPAIDIIVRKRLGPERREAGGKLNLAEIDELILFVQQLAEFFTADALANGARWKETDIRRAFVPAHLRENCGQFTAQIRVTFDMPNAL